MREQLREEKVILEFIRQGRFVKITAIDVITGEEVSAIGDARLHQDMLGRLAIRKLRKVQSKR